MHKHITLFIALCTHTHKHTHTHTHTHTCTRTLVPANRRDHTLQNNAHHTHHPETFAAPWVSGLKQRAREHVCMDVVCVCVCTILVLSLARTHATGTGSDNQRARERPLFFHLWHKSQVWPLRSSPWLSTWGWLNTFNGLLHAHFMHISKSHPRLQRVYTTVPVVFNWFMA
jgi:hypothetical protein